MHNTAFGMIVETLPRRQAKVVALELRNDAISLPSWLQVWTSLDDQCILAMSTTKPNNPPILG